LRYDLLYIIEEISEARVEVIQNSPQLGVIGDLFVVDGPYCPQEGLDRLEARVYPGSADERLLRLNELHVIFGIKIEPVPNFAGV